MLSALGREELINWVVPVQVPWELIPGVDQREGDGSCPCQHCQPAKQEIINLLKGTSSAGLWGWLWGIKEGLGNVVGVV